MKISLFLALGLFASAQAAMMIENLTLKNLGKTYGSSNNYDWISLELTHRSSNHGF